MHLFNICFTGRKLVGGSDIGGMKEIQEMLDFCGKHNITANIELIKMDYINTAIKGWPNPMSGTSWFVIDVADSISK